MGALDIFRAYIKKASYSIRSKLSILLRFEFSDPLILSVPFLAAASHQVKAAKTVQPEI
jgi:hypothetical protein